VRGNSRCAMLGVLWLLITGCTSTADPTITTVPNEESGSAASAPANTTAFAPPTPSIATGVSATPGPETGAPAEPGTDLPFPEPSFVQLPRAQQDALQAAVDRIAKVAAPAGMRGATAAVVTPHGSWTGAVGVDGNGQPLDPNAMMGIGAITHTITAAQVLALTASGRVDLDTPVSTYLTHPTLQNDPTVRQLLSHTSGIKDYVTPEFLTAVTSDPTRSWTALEVLRYTPDDLTDPGPPFRYSNSDYVLLGLLIEAITEQPYATAVFDGVLDGTGPRMVLQDAQLPIPPLAAPDHTDSGTPDGHYLPNRSIASSAGASGGAAADAATLADWGYRLYGGRVLPLDLTAELSDPVTPGYGLGTLHLDSAPIRPATGPAQDPQLTGLGAIGHDGSIPGYSSTLLVVPDRSLSIAVLIVGPELVAIETHIITAGLLTALT